MKKHPTSWLLLLACLVFTACEKTELVDTSSDPAVIAKAPATSSTTYSGRSTAVNAVIWSKENNTVVSRQTILSQTVFLPVAGGSFQANSLNASIPGVLTSDSLGASIAGLQKVTSGESVVTKLNVVVNGNVITADSIISKSSVGCVSLFGGSTTFKNLAVNGIPVAVTGAINQVVALPRGGYLFISEQSSSKKGSNLTRNVTGLHIVVPNIADIKLATVYTDIKC